MSKPVIPPMPPNVPRVRSRVWPNLARGVLRLCGWRLLGAFPDQRKMVVIGAPHSSYWDGVWGFLFKIALSIDIKIMIKREVLEGPLGVVLRPFGLIPINRSAKLNVVGQMVQRFHQTDQMWLGITPEGTRKPVKEWKSGFLRIAHDAQVPVLPVFFDYPSKTFILGEPVQPSGDLEADMRAIRALFRPYRGKHRNSE